MEEQGLGGGRDTSKPIGKWVKPAHGRAYLPTSMPPFPATYSSP